MIKHPAPGYMQFRDLMEINPDGDRKVQRKAVKGKLWLVTSGLLVALSRGRPPSNPISSHIYTCGKAAFPEDTKCADRFALSYTFAPLASEMAEEMLKLWETQIPRMEDQTTEGSDKPADDKPASKSSKRTVGSSQSARKSEKPKLPSNYLMRFTELRDKLQEHERPVLSPLSPYRNGFIQMSELELLQTIASSHKDDVSAALGLAATEPLVRNYKALLNALPPGQFLSNLMVPIGFKRGYRKQIQIASMTSKTIENGGKRWALTGSFRTNGLELQVLAFNLHVTKKHVPQAAPGQIDPKTGTERYLSEIRNVFKQPKDVATTFPNPPAGLNPGEDVCIVAIDYGQALMQPNFRGRLELEFHKDEYRIDKDGNEVKVRDIELGIPQRTGVTDEYVSSDYLPKAAAAHPDLHRYYNGDFWHRRTTWDVKKAKEGEYHVAICAILAMVHDVPKEKVLFVLGLGKFGTKSKMASLHGTFDSLFLKTIRSLGYAVVGINEYYSSQKCPRNKPQDPQNPCNHGFIGRVTLRRSYCPKCHVYFHRDLLASQNMIVAAKAHLTVDAMQGGLKERPLYLQPLNDDGTPRWKSGLPSTKDG
ncbi:hypothetical protein BG000_008192 [Podila horticola]|nr:hypothetical protein BG000_008192 [Podila horticola]